MKVAGHWSRIWPAPETRGQSSSYYQAIPGASFSQTQNSLALPLLRAAMGNLGMEAVRVNVEPAWLKALLVILPEALRLCPDGSVAIGPRAIVS